MHPSLRMAMAKGADLPRELLESIADLLYSPFDYLHFRSVCSSWRHAAPLRPSKFSSPFVIPFIDGMSARYGSLYLSKRSILQLGIPEPYRRMLSTDWLIQIEEIVPQRVRLLSPLTGSKLNPLPQEIPEILNITDIRVSEIFEEYVIEHVVDRPSANPLRDDDNLYMEKVAFASNRSGEFIILTLHLSGRLAMLKSGDKEWSAIPELELPFADVIFFDGKFYAVDGAGQLVIVDTESLPSLIFASASVFGGALKYLLKCDGNLLLVDVFLTTERIDVSDFEDDDYNIEDRDGVHVSYVVMNERKVRFEVYRLNPLESKWVKLDNLNDWMLILGDHCAFSVLASDFPGCKGNIIYFTYYCRKNQIIEEDCFFRGRGIGVYDMDDGSLYELPNHQGLSQIFWPPPSWLTSTSFKVLDLLPEAMIRIQEVAVSLQLRMLSFFCIGRAGSAEALEFMEQ